MCWAFFGSLEICIIKCLDIVPNVCIHLPSLFKASECPQKQPLGLMFPWYYSNFENQSTRGYA